MGYELLLSALFLAAGAAPGDAPDAPESVPACVEQLAHRDASVRWHAAYALGQAGPKAAAAVGPLMAVLENRGEDEYVRGAAAWALGRIGPEAVPAMPLLIRVLASQHVSVRRNAAQALGALGPMARGDAAELEKLLDDADPMVRVNAARSLWRTGRSPKAVPSLLTSLREGGPSAYPAAVALGELDADPGPIIPALVQSLNLGDEDVRRAAIHSLSRIGPRASSSLMTALKDRNATVRRSAARALGLIGRQAQDAESALSDAAADPDPQVRQTAAWALAQVRSP